MPMILIAINLVVAVIGLILIFVIWQKVKQPVGQNLDQALREELRQSRDEASKQARELREEVATAQTKANAVLVQTVNTLGENQKVLLGNLIHATQETAAAIRSEIETLVQRTIQGLHEIQATTRAGLDAVRQTMEQRLLASQEAQDRRGAEVTKAVQALTESNRKELDGQREKIQTQLKEIEASTNSGLVTIRQTIEQKLQASQEAEGRRGAEVTKAVQELTESNRKELDNQGQKIQTKVGEVVAALKALETTHQAEQEKARAALDKKFQQIQESNEKKLEEMRKTVDEKLHETLEKRLGESFKLVSERLEAVQRGLGEMQSLATGVGDLKRVLTNVKERGTWGEYQLGAILEQILTDGQYERNVHVQAGRETVEFAVKLPGKAPDQDKPVWLPIDAKFPKEDYERLVAASVAADPKAVEEATKALLDEVRKEAKDIHTKYISPPATTDFGILFLPTEGLYAEVLRQPGFQDELQRKYRVMVAGPTTLSAILSSLRVGFQTLAIEKRAHEVWTVLGAVKTEFGKFGGVLAKMKKQINTVANTIDETGVRTRAMERELRVVEQLPADQAAAVLELPAPTAPAEPEEANDEDPKET